MEDVVESINTLRDRGETLGFNWGDNYPEVKGAGTPNHWQGIQRIQISGLDFPYIVVSSSHRNRIVTPDGIEEISKPAHFAVVEMASRGTDGRRLRSNRLEYEKLTRDVSPKPFDLIVKANVVTSDYDHPGAMQAIGKYLFVGADGNIEHSRDTALLTLWDLSDPYFPRQVWEPKWELPITTAASVGIVRLEDGRYLALRAWGDAKIIEFHILANDIEVSPLSYLDSAPWDVWEYGELKSELLNFDGSLDLHWGDLGSFLGKAGYQNTNIVTECGSGTLYLVASHGRRPSGFGGADYVDAYRLDVPAERPNPDISGEGVVITKVARRRLFPEENAGERQGDLQAAGGVYVSPDNKLYFYASEHGVSGSGFVRMIEFGPQVPQSEINFIDEAWVELYDKKEFGGRSIILDYVDQNLRDYEDFSYIEEFNDLASSVIYGLPRGYKIRLFGDFEGRGGYLDLIGSGRVDRIEDFGGFELSNGDNANDQFSSAKWLFGVTTVDRDVTEVLPAAFELFQNYPNPFNSGTIITYRVSEKANVALKIYDLRGQLIRALVEREQLAGFYSVKWDTKDELGSEVASGTYLYRLEMGEFITARKLTVLR